MSGYKTGHGMLLPQLSQSADAIHKDLEAMVKLMESAGVKGPCYLVTGMPEPHLEISIPVRPKEPDMGFQFRSPPFSIPVIRSPYILPGYVDHKPSIIDDFDRWFAEARRRVSRRRWLEHHQRMLALNSCWRE